MVAGKKFHPAMLSFAEILALFGFHVGSWL
jgi:hypothetical protein